MTLWVDVARVAIVGNLVVLLALSYLWGRTYLALRSKHSLGLLVFGGFLLGENVFELYFFVLNPTLAQWIVDVPPPIVQQLMMTFRLLQLLGLVVLLWVTWD